MTDVFAKIISLLDSRGCKYRIHEHERVITVRDAIDIVPELTENLVKTVVFRKKDGYWVLAALRCNDSVDYKSLAAAVGVNRRDLRSVPPEVIHSELGFEIGGVGPFPIHDHIQVVLDDSTRHLGSIICGSGMNTRSIEIDVSDLVRAGNALVAPISKRPPHESDHPSG